MPGLLAIAPKSSGIGYSSSEDYLLVTSIERTRPLQLRLLVGWIRRASDAILLLRWRLPSEVAVGLLIWLGMSIACWLDGRGGLLVSTCRLASLPKASWSRRRWRFIVATIFVVLVHLAPIIAIVGI